MESLVDLTFLDCPEYLDKDGAVRCGLPAEEIGRASCRERV